MSDMLLEMKNVTKKFPGVIALNDVSINLKHAEILGIVGENGAGKSTLMKVLSGSYPHSSYDGEIWIDGEQKTFNSPADGKDAGIAMIYQEVNVLFDASLAENIYMGNLPGNGMFVDYKSLYEETDRMLKEVGIEAGPKTIARKLNSGQIQLLAILRGIATNPKILVLDEPTTALTNQEVDILMGFLRNLKERGISCIYISHKLEEIFEICDRVTVIRDGNVIRTKDIGEWDQEDMIEDMIGRKVENMYAKIPHEITDEVVMEVKDLVVPHPTIKNKNIVDHISFQLHKGEILGLGGLVGAGRSETLEAIFGKTTEGVSMDLTVKGNNIKIKYPEDAIKAGIGFITEERKTTGFVDTMNILENISLPSLPDLPGKFFLDKKVEKEKATEQFNQLQVKAPSINTMVVNLSGGNQQKVILGKWLMKHPDILFVDEPTKGIDVGTKSEFYKILGQLAAEGISIVMVSSDMPELVSVSDRVLVMCEGSITGELVGDQITQSNVMKAAIAGSLKELNA